jgi:urea carboxylase
VDGRGAGSDFAFRCRGTGQSFGDPDGHAIEARICGGPDEAFQPSPGVVTDVSWPVDARVDTWIRVGGDVTPFYDPSSAR